MAGRLNTVAARLVALLLLSQAVLLPLLYFAIESGVKRSIENTFLDDARLAGRVLADSLETLDFRTMEYLVVERLDSAVLGGKTVFAAVEFGDTLLSSSLLDPAAMDRFVEDFRIGDHGDDVYYMSLPIGSGANSGFLRLGFDELPTRESFDSVQSTIIYALVFYLVLTLIMTAYFASTVVSPLQWLRHASRAVSSGDVDRELHTESDLVEIRELAKDLESMRSRLVGMNAQLQQEIAERELAETERRDLESQLFHAQRLESLGTLAGGVAHEFNNVLQPIVLYTELALEDLPKDSPDAENLERVLDLANRARGLSRQILTFGRPDSDKEFQRVDLNLIVNEALTMIRALLPATVGLQVDVKQKIGEVRCDQAEIKQLIVNLCNNAFQALSGDKGQIHVSLHEEIISASMAREGPALREGEYAVLQVADTGVGMDSKTVERIFEPFFTTREVGKGTGLGLSVVHGIVVRHGGEIQVASEPGKGTRIRVYLPLVGDDERNNEEREPDA